MIPDLVSYAAIASYYLFPGFSQDHLSIPIMLICVCGLGIPHGSMDIQLYEQIQLKRTGKSMAMVGLLNYFAIMAVWLACWALFPTFSFWAFMLVSVYHFGEADLDYIELNSAVQAICYISRGLLIIGLTMTSNPDVTFPIIGQLIPLDKDLFLLGAHAAFPICVAQHFLLLIASLFLDMAGPKCDKAFPVEIYPASISIWITEIRKSISFVLLFMVTGPLVGFSIYFGLWHSLSCIVADIQFFKQVPNVWFNPKSPSVTFGELCKFYILAAPYTVVGMCFMVLAYAIAIHSPLAIEINKIWAVFVMGISVLTGAHIWLVAALHWSFVHLDPCSIYAIIGLESKSMKRPVASAKVNLDPFNLEFLLPLISKTHDISKADFLSSM